MHHDHNKHTFALTAFDLKHTNSRSHWHISAQAMMVAYALQYKQTHQVNHAQHNDTTSIITL